MFDDGLGEEIPTSAQQNATTFWELESDERAAKILKEVIDALRLMGGLLTLGGAISLYQFARAGEFVSLRVAIVAGVVAVPGVLYLVGSVGLTYRRRWAWVMSFVITWLLLVAVILLTALFEARNWGLGTAGALIPLGMYASMPGLILIYMLRARRAIREAELQIAKGFGVIPVARVAGVTDLTTEVAKDNDD